MSPERDLKPGPPEYETRMPAALQRSLVELNEVSLKIFLKCLSKTEVTTEMEAERFRSDFLSGNFSSSLKENTTRLCYRDRLINAV